MQQLKIGFEHSYAYFQEVIQPLLTQQQLRVLAVALCALALLVAALGALWLKMKGKWPFNKVIPEVVPPAVVHSPVAEKVFVPPPKPIEASPVVKDPKVEIAEAYSAYLWMHGSHAIKQVCIDLGFEAPIDVMQGIPNYDAIGINFIIPGHGRYISPDFEIKSHSKEELLTKLVESIKHTLVPYYSFNSLLSEWYKQGKFKEYIASREVWDKLTVPLSQRGVELHGAGPDNARSAIVDGKVAICSAFRIGFTYSNYLSLFPSSKDRKYQTFALNIDYFPTDALDTDEAIWKRWQGRLDAQLEDFLMDVAGLKPAEPGILKPIFHSETKIEIENKLKLIESMMELEKEYLVKHLKADQYANLQDVLKQIKKHGALKYHPDKAAAAGIKQEDMVEEFKVFYQAVTEANTMIGQQKTAILEPSPTPEFEDMLSDIEGIGGLATGSLSKLVKEKQYPEIIKSLINIRYKLYDAATAAMGTDKFEEADEELERYEKMAALIRSWVTLKKSLL